MSPATPTTEGFRSTVLVEYLQQYFLAKEIQPTTIKQYERIFRTFENWYGETLMIHHLTDDLVNRLLLSMSKNGRSTHYRRSTRATVLAVWRAAADDGLVAPPQKIRSIRLDPPDPYVWTTKEVKEILRVAGDLQGCFESGRGPTWRVTEIRRAPYWVSLIHTAWDTGLRRRDLHALRPEDIGETFVWKTQKRRKWVRCRLRQMTLKTIRDFGPKPGRPIWPLWGTNEAFGHAWRSLVRRAGVPPHPFKCLRKSAGTWAEVAAPGRGHELLGNERKTFETFYWDRSRSDDVPSPPPL